MCFMQRARCCSVYSNIFAHAWECRFYLLRSSFDYWRLYFLTYLRQSSWKRKVLNDSFFPTDSLNRILCQINQKPKLNTDSSAESRVLEEFTSSPSCFPSKFSGLSNFALFSSNFCAIRSYRSWYCLFWHSCFSWDSDLTWFSAC
jgi:poly(A) polymerase Pap1